MTWTQPKCLSMDEWIKKMWSIYNGILHSHKEEWNLTIGDNMDGPGGYYAKWNKSDRERQIPHDFTYMWNLENKTNNKQNKNRLIDTENGLVVDRGQQECFWAMWHIRAASWDGSWSSGEPEAWLQQWWAKSMTWGLGVGLRAAAG